MTSDRISFHIVAALKRTNDDYLDCRKRVVLHRNSLPPCRF